MASFRNSLTELVEQVGHVTTMELHLGHENPSSPRFVCYAMDLRGLLRMFRCQSLVLLCTLTQLTSSFKVLDVGAPRTGTQSMYDAMKLLGLNPLHTGYVLRARPVLCEYLFRNGSLDEALGLFQGFDAAMDEPVMLMYEEIMAAFPEAKFLLTISDAESWFDNYLELIHSMMKVQDLKVMMTNSSQQHHYVPSECTAMTSWGCNFNGSPTAEQKAQCLQNYDRHIQRVQQTIPPHRLLVYNWSDGWAPLAHFLETAIPEEDFPNSDAVKSHLDAALEGLEGLEKILS